MSVSDKKQIITQNNKLIADNVQKVYKAGQDSQQETIDALNKNLKSAQTRCTVYIGELNATKGIIKTYGVNVATKNQNGVYYPFVSDKIADVYAKGVESQQPTINSLNETVKTLTEQNNEYNTELEDTAQAMSNVGVESVTIDNTAEKVVDVFEQGKKSQYDEFWDAFQQNGNKTDYSYAFYHSHLGWGEIFYPKYDIKPTYASSMFQYSMLTNFNLKERLQECGVIMDFSKCTSCTSCFNYAYLTHLPELNFASLKAIPTMFYDCSIHTIDKIVLKSDGTQTFSGTFSAFKTLVNVVFEGVIGNNIAFNSCTQLSHDSITSIIAALSQSTSGLTVTFSKTAINNAFGINVDDMTTYPEGSEFYNLRNSKSNWNFSYA